MADKSRRISPGWESSICFTIQPRFGHPWIVRGFLTACLVLSLFSVARAQTQEQKLVDRLLRPDMHLRNPAQNKKFVADGTSIDKRASVSTFYVQKRDRENSFAGTRKFSTRRFYAWLFHGRSRTNADAKKQSSDSEKNYATSSKAGVHSVHDSHRSVDSREFVGERPFLDQGKNQKALNRKNNPLTVEQVRELLNKNR
jgi:hypothetical protein